MAKINRKHNYYLISNQKLENNICPVCFSTLIFFHSKTFCSNHLCNFVNGIAKLTQNKRKKLKKQGCKISLIKSKSKIELSLWPKRSGDLLQKGR